MMFKYKETWYNRLSCIANCQFSVAYFAARAEIECPLQAADHFLLPTFERCIKFSFLVGFIELELNMVILHL